MNSPKATQTALFIAQSGKGSLRLNTSLSLCCCGRHRRGVMREEENVREETLGVQKGPATSQDRPAWEINYHSDQLTYENADCSLSRTR